MKSNDHPRLERIVIRTLNEAIERGLWTPKSNSAKFDLGEIMGAVNE